MNIIMFFEMLMALFLTMKIGNIGDFEYWSWQEVFGVPLISMLVFWVLHLITTKVISLLRDR